MDDRVLPHSITVEQALLGALIVNAEHYDLLPSTLTEASFFRDAHRRIFAAIHRMRDRKLGVDMVTLCDELRRVGDLDDVGGAAYVSSLTDGVPRSANAPHYATVILDHAVRRAVISLANVLLGRAYDQDTAESLIALTQSEALALTVTSAASAVAVGALVAPTFAAMERASGGHAMVIGVTTGFEQLDSSLGGLQRGDLVLIAARPSVGKTSLAMNLAEHVGVGGREVLVFSLEMTKEQLMFRLVCSMARVDSFRLRNGFANPADHGRIAAALSDLSTARIHIDDSGTLTITEIASRARRHRLERGSLDLIVVDYLQLVSPPATMRRGETENAAITAVSQGLKAMAKEMDVPVVALSQLSRAPEDRSTKKVRDRPKLSDLRGSGSLEQDADVVLFLFQPDDDEPVVEVLISKQRNGPTGVVRLTFLKALTRFENLAQARES